ncbi:rieske [2fe2s] domain containing protein, partial [Acanthamoeba castellanii str. Neff]
FVLKEVQTETILRPPAEAFTPAGRTKPLALPFQTTHTYQIMPYEEEGRGEWVDVGSVDEVGHRKRVCVEGRDVLVLNVGSGKDDYCALDSVCYHFGGPLSEGDIEDIQGRQCIVCPWHKYYIDVHTGEGILKKGLDGPTHEVKVEGRHVFVKLDQGRDELASDHYAHMGAYRFE